MQPSVSSSFRGGRVALARELAERQGRVSKTKLRDLTQRIRQTLELVGPLEASHRLYLRVRSAARPDEIRVVRICETVCSGAGRREHRVLLESEQDVVRADDPEHVRDRLDPLRVGDRMTRAVGDAKRDLLLFRNGRDELCPVERRRPDLEVRIRRAGQRAGAE